MKLKTLIPAIFIAVIFWSYLGCKNTSSGSETSNSSNDPTVSQVTPVTPGTGSGTYGIAWTQRSRQIGEAVQFYFVDPSGVEITSLPAGIEEVEFDLESSDGNDYEITIGSNGVTAQVSAPGSYHGNPIIYSMNAFIPGASAPPPVPAQGEWIMIPRPPPLGGWHWVPY